MRYRAFAVPFSQALFAAAIWIALGRASYAESPLPLGSQQPAIEFDHFPDRLHAVVFRNWQLVEPERIAKALGTSADKITAIATSMGLPADPQVPPEFRRRGYITIVRRNWHLLPYEQLLTLIDMNADELAFRLREDDFLWLKLGMMKPRCAPVRYAEPDRQARERAAEIKKLLESEFGEALTRPGERPFAFVEHLTRTEGAAGRKQVAVRPASEHADRQRLRFIYSYFGAYGDPLLEGELDPYPDGLLEKLAGLGVNGVWLHVILRQLAPGGQTFPEFGDGHRERLENLKHLVDRAGKHGIKVYLYMNEPRSMPKDFFKNRPQLAGTPEGDFTAICTSRPEVRRWLSGALEHVFRTVPDLGGVFTITASENLTNCASHGGQKLCPQCAKRSGEDIIKEINATIEEGVHRGSPQAKVVVWDWQWDEVARVDMPKVIAGLPKSSWLMSVSEWNLRVNRGGVEARVGEYSISAVGPGPRATGNWRLAKSAGLKTVAKVQLNNTWELSSVPYLPVLELVARHCSNLAKMDTDGMMLGWTLGGYPSLNLEVAKRFEQEPGASPQQVLDHLAAETFGPQAGPHVREAWTAFSRAFEQFPYSVGVVYQGSQTYGPSNLLYPRRTGYKATMLGFAYDDAAGWCPPYPPAVFARQMNEVAVGWAKGIKHVEEARRVVDGPHRAAVEDLLSVSRAAQLHFASAAAQTQFVLARELLEALNTPQRERFKLAAQIADLAAAEATTARQLYDITRRDSRIGFEASNHYYYVPLDLVEKVINCHWVRRKMGAGD